MSAITAERLTKRYGSFTAVDGLSFELEPGTVTGFVGVNGAGKSTTMRMLLGLSKPSSGRALIEGTPYAALPHPTRTCGALLDPNVFHPRRTGHGSLRVLAAAAHLPESRIDEVINIVDLNDAAYRRVGGYSTGMRQRLALAAALLGDPGILVLDEPSNGLDPLGIQWLRRFLRTLGDEGRTVLVSSHQLAELGQTVDDVLVIHRGRLLVRGALADLGARSGTGSLEELFLNLITEGELP